MDDQPRAMGGGSESEGGIPPAAPRQPLLSPEGQESLGDGRWQPVSRVSATVRTQIEYNDPRTGFQRLDGTNELVLVVRFPR